MSLTPQALQANREQFDREGYTVVRSVFSPMEIAEFVSHYMEMRRQGAHEGDFAGVPIGGDDNVPDPLQQYPRMIHMHRWDGKSLNWMLDDRINTIMTALLDKSPYAVQTMLYFKPPGARGQGLPLDDCDEANGCMQVVPGSHLLPLLCTVPSDTTQSFTDVMVPVPEGMQVTPVIMKAGDMFFFNGQMIHGSYPNTSSDRFRRSLIGHYIVGDAEKVAKYYHPVLRMDGSEVELGISKSGGQCGVWVERDGKTVIEMRDNKTKSLFTEDPPLIA